MSEPVVMVELVRELKSRARGRACVVLTHEYEGQKEWAAELARQTGSEHLDLLDCFAQDESLSARIGDFGVSTLFEFLKGKSKSPVLIISGVEFLKATWGGQPTAMGEFGRRLETWNHKQPCLLFVMQYDTRLASRTSSRFQYRFVVDQKETLALT
jgi:hypothetical protein